MYRFLSILFILLISIIHYILSTYHYQPFDTKQITLNKHVQSPQYNVYATCIDKEIISNNPFADLQLMSTSNLSFVVLFFSNPLLQCHQITYAIDFTQINEKTPQIHFEKILILKALTGQTQTIKLPKGQSLKIDNLKQFMLVLTVEQTKKLTNQKNHLQNNRSTKITLGIQSEEYLQSILSLVFWFSWFNLIGISLISYYRKNVFNDKIQLSTSITILMYLIWLSFTHVPSFQSLGKQLQLVMICFILLICIKSKLSLPETVIILFFSLVNQISLQFDINTQILWLIYTANLFNVYTIALGQNVEAAKFSVFSFLIQSGLVNPFFDIVNPLALSFIFVNLVFGPVIYELLELRQDLNTQHKKTQQKLQSYEISETDHLFID